MSAAYDIDLIKVFEFVPRMSLLSVADVSRRLIQSIHDQTVFEAASALLSSAADTLDPDARSLAEQAQATSRRISSETATVQQRVLARLQGVGLTVSLPVEISEDTGLQYHEFPLHVDGSQLDRVLACLDAEGFAVDAVLRDKWRSVRRAATGLYLMAWDDVSTRLRLSWRAQSQGVMGKLRPVAADFAFAPVPDPLWPLYLAVKPIRVGVERITGVRTADRLGLKSGSFSLGTPPSLLPALFRAASLGPDDVFVDLGCGDGRVAIAAAEQMGCRAVGIERNATLVAEGRAMATERGLGARVDIVQGSALEADLSEATVLFLFLPETLVAQIVPVASAKAKPGARIVVHEQLALPEGLVPDASEPIFSENAMTVAHRWDIGSTQ